MVASYYIGVLEELINLQKQPPRGVLSERWSKNMQQIYRRTPLPKCNFNKVAKESGKIGAAIEKTSKRATLLKSLFGMGVLLYLFLRTPLGHCF